MELTNTLIRIPRIILLLTVVYTDAFSQSAAATYFIQFTDKDNTPYSLLAPSQFLSARALQRRATQGVAITEQDLPVDPAYIDSVLSFNSVVFKCKSKWFNSVTV